MRGVNKSKPPTTLRRSNDFRPGRQEVEHDLKQLLSDEADPLAKRKLARSIFESLDKPAIRQALWQEQCGLCVYCEGRLRDPASEADTAKKSTTGIQPIAHWQPIAHSPEDAVTWTNLHLSCDSRTSCDSIQGDQPLGLDSPSRCAFEELIEYDIAGNAKVKDGVLRQVATPLAAALGSGNTNTGVLGLNSEGLCDARATVLKTMKSLLARQFEGKRATSAQLGALATRQLEKRPLPAFVSVEVDWLKRQAARR